MRKSVSCGSKYLDDYGFSTECKCALNEDSEVFNVPP